jgi:Na+/H+ antiporter NhaD/arsenite permease-like protein
MSYLASDYDDGHSFEENAFGIDCSANATATMDVPMHVRVLGTTVFVLAWPFIVFDIAPIPIGRPTAAMAGGMFMVICRVFTQNQVYEIIGERDNLQTLYLLIGMMILSYFFEREGILQAMLIKSFRADQPFHKILWKVCVMSGALAAFVTNDAACVILTPLLLEEHRKQGRSNKELLPFCLAIATSANIGSAATVFGNPQNAYIASKAHVNLAVFFRAILPASIVGVAINIGLLYLMSWKLDAFTTDNKYLPVEGKNEIIPENNEDMDAPTEKRRSRTSSRMLSTSIPMLQSGQHREAVQNHYDTPQQRARHETDPLLRSRREAEVELSARAYLPWTPKRKIFALWLSIVSVAVICLLAVPSHVAHFNLGLVPMGAAISSMMVDAVLNKINPNIAIMATDWTVIVMFMGLFAWDGGFEVTGYPRKIFDDLKHLMDVHTAGGIALFSIFVTIGSNVLSNVPLVILLITKLSCLPGTDATTGSLPLEGCLLAWVSTVAGNLTLIGSVANLIVAEKAKSTVGYVLGFWDYLKFGLPSTIIITIIGLPVVALLA